MSHQATDSVPSPLPISTDSPGDPTVYPDDSAASASATSIANPVPDEQSPPSPTAPNGSRGSPPIPIIPTMNLGCNLGGVPMWLNMNPTTGDPVLVRAVLNAQIAGAAYRLDPTPENKEALMEATMFMFERVSELKCKAFREEGFPWYGMRYYCLVWFGVWEWMDVLWLAGTDLGLDHQDLREPYVGWSRECLKPRMWSGSCSRSSFSQLWSLFLAGFLSSMFPCFEGSIIGFCVGIFFSFPGFQWYRVVRGGATLKKTPVAD